MKSCQNESCFYFNNNYDNNCEYFTDDLDETSHLDCPKYMPDKPETAWEMFRKLFERFGPKVEIKIYDYIHSGQQVNCRKGNNFMCTFILENTGQQALDIMKEIEKKFEYIYSR